MGWRSRLVLAGIGFIGVLFLWAIIARAFAGMGNTQKSRFDTLIVLGTGVDSEGNPTPAMQARVAEAVREYERGIAPRMILSGGAVHNHFVEAEVMARAAEAEGVPKSAIVVESKAHNTIENACFAGRILREHGWGSAEVISSDYHLPRSAMIFRRMPFEWRMHAASSSVGDSSQGASSDSAFEILKTMRYLIYARWADDCSL